MAANILEQIRKAQEAAKTKPETEAPKPADEMTDANLGAAEVKPTPRRRRGFSCVLRFFGFPDFVTGL